jgi:hypothetical protein
MISPVLRTFLYLLAAGYAATGWMLYLMPAWASADHFAWRVSPFVAMTIGGWCLGAAWLAFVIARRAQWPAALPSIVFLALFGLFEGAVLLAFRERVLLESPLALVYIATISGTALFAVAALVEGFLKRPVLVAVGAPTGALSYLLTMAFIMLVGFLGIYGLLAVDGARGLNGGIFPELISPFSLRAFGAFYFALALAAFPVMWTGGLGNILNHGFAAYGLIVFITVAAMANIKQFDFVARPTQAIYIGVYILVGAVVGGYLLCFGSGTGKR